MLFLVTVISLAYIDIAEIPTGYTKIKLKNIVSKFLRLMKNFYVKIRIAFVKF